MNAKIFGTHETSTIKQLADVAVKAERVALMADGHLGYVMPIGGVAARERMQKHLNWLETSTRNRENNTHAGTLTPVYAMYDQSVRDARQEIALLFDTWLNAHMHERNAHPSSPPASPTETHDWLLDWLLVRCDVKSPDGTKIFNIYSALAEYKKARPASPEPTP